MNPDISEESGESGDSDIDLDDEDDDDDDDDIGGMGIPQQRGRNQPPQGDLDDDSDF